MQNAYLIHQGLGDTTHPWKGVATQPETASILILKLLKQELWGFEREMYLRDLHAIKMKD